MDHIDWQLVHTIWQCSQLGIQIPNFRAQLLNLDGVAHLLTALGSASSLLYLMVQLLQLLLLTSELIRLDEQISQTGLGA